MAILRNVSFTAISQAACVALQFGVGVALARMLVPEDYGLIGLTGVFTGFAGIFADLGLGSAIVNSREIGDEELSFVFWLNLLIGLLLTAVVFVAAPAIAWFYHEPRLLGVAETVALSFVVAAPAIVSGSLLNKSLAFGRLAVAEVIAAALAGALGVYLAIHGFGVYSLALMSVGGQAARTILICSLAGWLPGWPCWSVRLHKLMSYGGNLFGFSSLNYWARNGDNLLIGKFCGASELGIYSRAYSLLLFPLGQIQQVLGRVMFPTLSSRHNSSEDITRPYLLACQSIALLTFPLMAGLVVVADDFVYALYGAKWAEAIPVIRVLAIAGMGSAVGSSVGWIYTAAGRTDLLFRWGLFATPVMLLSFVAGLHWGALGVASAYTAALYLLLWYPQWQLAGAVINLSFGALMTNLWKPFLAAVSMALVVQMLKLNLNSRPMSRLLLCILVGSVTYCVTLHTFQSPAYRYILDRVRGRAA